MSYPQIEKPADFQIGSACLQAQWHRSANHINHSHCEAQWSQNHISNVYYKVSRLKMVKLCEVQSCFGCLFTWSRHVYRAELQTSAQSLQLHTLKLQCATYCTRYCQPHRLSDNRTPDPSFCSFSLTAHTAEMPCNQLQPPFPWAQHAPSFTPKCWSAEEEPTPHVGMSCYTTLQIRRIHMTI